jgi:hypothetical protein
MKVKLLYVITLFILSCKTRTSELQVEVKKDQVVRELSPSKDSSWLVRSDGTYQRVHDQDIYVIGGRQVLPNGKLSSDTIRRVVTRDYRPGDTAFIDYQKINMVVIYVEKRGN